MPSRLKSFELTGYKTFASKTEFLFADGITAIIGPNGSGKSNIADALRWVLGEQSYGLLRGKKTEDMIFAGSENRSRAGMAQATVIFNNGDGWLPIDFSEVAITRRAYRDGENEYLLNGQKVRLKDVSELLAKSGLAERTYTIIGQGLVDAALALKAEDRRRLFEEAAGIGLYRARREESLRRLDNTKRNLDRVQDILAELQPRLRSLERQAKRAQEYDQICANLHIKLREYYGYHWHLAQSEFNDALNAARKQEEVLSAAQLVQVRVDDEISALRQKLHQLNLELGTKQKQLLELNQQREIITRKHAIGQERIRLLIQQRSENQSEIERQREILALLEERCNLAQSEVEQLTIEMSEHQAKLLEIEQLFKQQELERLGIEKIAETAKRTLSEIVNQQAHIKARIDEKRALRDRQQASLKTAINNIERTQLELDAANVDAGKAVLALNEATVNLENTSAQYQSVSHEYKQIEIDISQIQKEKNQLEGQLTRRKTEFEVVKQAEMSLNGYAEGSQILFTTHGNLDNSGLLGVIGSHLIVPEEFERAISAALGEYINGVVYSHSGLVKDSIELLRTKTARGAILPLDRLKVSTRFRIDAAKIPGENQSILGVAVDLIQFPSDFRKVIDILLGQVIVVKDRADAEALLVKLNAQSFPNLRVVTLDGELYSTNGMIMVGAPSLGIISRPRRLVQLGEDLEVLGRQRDEIYQRLSQFENKLVASGENLHSIEKRLKNVQIQVNQSQEKLRSIQLTTQNLSQNHNWHLEQKELIEKQIYLDMQSEKALSVELENIEGLAEKAREDLALCNGKLGTLIEAGIKDEVSYWKTRYAVSEQAVNDANRRYQDRKGEVDRVSSDIGALENRVETISHELIKLESEQVVTLDSGKLISSEIDVLQSEITPLEAEANQLEDEQSSNLRKDTEARQRFRAAEHYHTQAKINLAKKQEILDSLRRRIEDDFGLVSFNYIESVTGPKPLPIEGMVEELPIVAALPPGADESIRQQKAQLKKLGPVSLEAQSEYTEVSERFKFMNEQVSDLHRAEKDLQEVIVELDAIMEREFRRTYDAVAQEFKSIFTRLFNGGMARLVLTDPGNISDTGIDIEARLPGRREQGLSLLSGGERSLTAVALVFALLRISPTPFCILDEVDAMLDEANVGRFREVLTELSEKTQFIVITHNRNTVQAAGVIYGVTMGRDTASQVISLKLNDVKGVYGV